VVFSDKRIPEALRPLAIKNYHIAKLFTTHPIQKNYEIQKEKKCFMEGVFLQRGLRENQEKIKKIVQTYI